MLQLAQVLGDDRVDGLRVGMLNDKKPDRGKQGIRVAQVLQNPGLNLGRIRR
ncbi:MAG: hypothetical protein ACO3P0_10930 [Quisquiliibacterium sp.]|jgi:hypothetical protein